MKKLVFIKKGLCLLIIFYTLSNCSSFEQFEEFSNYGLSNLLEICKTHYDNSFRSAKFENKKLLAAINKVRPNWSKCKIVKELKTNNSFISIPFSYSDGEMDLNFENRRRLVYQFDNKGNIKGSELLEIWDNIDDYTNVESFWNTLSVPTMFSGSIKHFDQRYNISQVDFYYKGNLTKVGKFIQKDKSPANNARFSKTQMCIDWYWEEYVNGTLVSSTYVGTTCDSSSSISGGNGTSGNGNGNISDNGGPKLCPGSFNIQSNGSVSYLRTYGVTAGVNNITMATFGITATVSRTVNSSDFNWLIWSTKYPHLILLGDVYPIEGGTKIYLTDNALKEVTADAIDYGAYESDEYDLIEGNVRNYLSSLSMSANWMINMYIPGSSLNLRNTRVPGDGSAVMVNSVDYFLQDGCWR